MGGLEGCEVVKRRQGMDEAYTRKNIRPSKVKQLARPCLN